MKEKFTTESCHKKMSQSTESLVSTETGDRARVQFPVTDIYFGM